MITTTQFRKDLKKIMPGYKWTVHRSLGESKPICLAAPGIQTAGVNRISTLQVIVREKQIGRLKEVMLEYDSRSSGFGKRAPWLSSCIERTLAKSLRGLQEDYEIRGENYLRHAADLQMARAKKDK